MLTGAQRVRSLQVRPSGQQQGSGADAAVDSGGGSGMSVHILHAQSIPYSGFPHTAPSELVYNQPQCERNCLRANIPCP